MEPQNTQQLVDLIESALKRALEAPHPSLQQFYGMMQYHLGWLDRNLSEAPEVHRGKRIRPLMTLLACQVSGGDIHQALPAAVAVELIHGFSLVHDDIQDRSEFRRHRESVWKVWGDAHAINVGDALFAMARVQSGTLLDKGVSPMRVLSAIRALDEACLALTEGQFLDMFFESSCPVLLDDYLWMIRGKTAALMACGCQVGAMIATEDSDLIAALYQFGYNLGMAFQIEDDLLGIWGDPHVTGKPAGDDILHRKKTLPVVFAWDTGLASDADESLRTTAQRILELYESEDVSPDDVTWVTEVLESIGARDYCAAASHEYTTQALAALSSFDLPEDALCQLVSLAHALFGRGS